MRRDQDRAGSWSRSDPSEIAGAPAGDFHFEGGVVQRNTACRSFNDALIQQSAQGGESYYFTNVGHEVR
jgi:hypothetical protein